MLRRMVAAQQEGRDTGAAPDLASVCANLVERVRQLRLGQAQAARSRDEVRAVPPHAQRGPQDLQRLAISNAKPY